MIAKLIVSHGRLAQEILSAAKTIAGGIEGFEFLCLDWTQGLEEARREIKRRIEGLDQGDGVLILTAMYGDTPANASRSLVRPGRVEVVAGVNLPMVVRLGCMPNDNMTLSDLARWIEGKGKTTIRRFGTAP